jgi:O-antigen/teichoic acid export membrane protein
LGTTTVGQYAPVVSLVSMLYLTASAAIELIFRPYYFEYVGSNRINASKKILKIYALCLFFISIIFITIFFLFSKKIVFLLLGPNFRDYYYLAPMISIGFSFLIFGYLFENICFAYKKTWKVFKIEGIAAITNIVILPIMIYNFGVNGIPLAIVFTYIIHFMSGFIISMRLLKK